MGKIEEKDKIQLEIYDRRRSKAVVCHMVHWNGIQSRTPSPELLEFCGWGSILRTIVNFCGIFLPRERNVCDRVWLWKMIARFGFGHWIRVLMLDVRMYENLMESKEDKMFLNKKDDFLNWNNLNLQYIYFKSI